ncbi:unnamed protein product [Victoria cruziana]
MARTAPPALLFAVLLLAGSGFPAEVESRASFACDRRDARTRAFAFCSASLPVPQRVRDLLGRLTLAEKVRLLVNNAAPVPRLGIARYEWWSEALHGVSNVGPGTRFGGAVHGATSFPQVILTAASFNASLWYEIGRVVSTEARAMYNAGSAGLTYWSPNVNVFRDPRWGRGQETPGEDPTVAGRYAAQYVRGLQEVPFGKDASRLKVAACCKHYTAYDLDNWQGNDRFHFNAKVSKQDLEDTYQVPFKACVMEGRAASVMCSYNQVNGVPTCADPALLKGTVRGMWGLNGYIVSDCDSLAVLYNFQHYTRNPEEAVAATLRAGLDLDCGPFLAQHAEDAVRKGKVGEKEIDAALEHTITVQMRLGMFDGDPSAQPLGQLGPADVCTPVNQELALEAARQGIVLLKNQGNVLPLSPARLRTVAVIGPNSDATVTMIGNYAGVPCRYTSPLQGIARYVKTSHNIGCRNVKCAETELFGRAARVARHTDATILVMGLDQTIEAEARDRESLLLPGHQTDLVLQVARASRGPVVLVLMSGGPVDLSFAKNEPKVAGILWAGYPGQAGGAAIADVIFGASNPGGKLPMTWYPQEYVTRVPMTSMNMRATGGYPGRTYRFYQGEQVYPFGYGLSYTTFTQALAEAPTMVSVPLDGKRNCGRNGTANCQAVRVTHARCDGLFLNVHVDVKNTGMRDGSHVLMVYSTPPAGHQAPIKQLVAFERIHLQANAQQQVRFAIDVCKDLSIVDNMGIQRLPMGPHVLQIGDLRHPVSLQAGGDL